MDAIAHPPSATVSASTSQIILTNLGADYQRRLFLQYTGEIADAGLGANWPE
jgi:hypothetical protein